MFDPEDLEQTPLTEKMGEADGQVQDLGIGEQGSKLGAERVVDAQMIHRKALGVLDSKSFPGRVRVCPVPVADVLVEVLGKSLLRHRRRPKVQSDGAVVELGDAHAGRFTHTDFKDAVVVHPLGEAAHGASHLGAQGPQHHRVAAFPRWDVDPGHESTLATKSLRRLWPGGGDQRAQVFST